MNTTPSDTWIWARDHAALGFVTALVAPLAAEVVVPLPLGWYAVHAALLATVTGAALGAAAHRVLLAFPDRARPAISLVGGPVVVGAWGALVASGAALIDHPGYAVLAFPCGALAGTGQGLWWAPVATTLARLDVPRWPVALLAGLTAPFLGLLGVFGVVFAFEAWT